MNLEASGIKSVTFYVASGPVECCDRCSAGIRNVYAVTYRDGQVQKYGSECINRILEHEPSLRTLFNRNAKLLRQYQDYLAILSGPIERMPRGSEYYGSGLYFIADSQGKDISFKHWFFHPEYDAEKNSNGKHYVVTDDGVRHVAKAVREIEIAKPLIAAEIARLEAFLAKVLRNCKAA